MIQVIFVCMGNICRSPLAEGLFRQRVNELGLADQINVDSAGMGTWHDGELPDARMRETAAQHGLSLDSRARKLRPGDIRKSDFIIVMDDKNKQYVDQLMATRNLTTPVHYMREFDPDATRDDEAVPDPYQGGMDGFQNVYDILDRSMGPLIAHIKQTHAI